MAKTTINELKLEIAEILEEAKKKKEKVETLKKRGASVEAYGLYDEAFDFSSPLGAYNLYKTQGAANFGPYTSAGSVVDHSFQNPNRGALQMNEKDEQALRMVVREVIQNGLVPSNSAWAPLMERQQKFISENVWERAENIFESWYMGQKEAFEAKQGKCLEKTEFKLDKKAQERATGKKNKKK